jgi:hypothetical protein
MHLLWLVCLSSYQLAHVNNGTINAECTNLAIGPVCCSDFYLLHTKLMPSIRSICLNLANQDYKVTYVVQSGDSCNNIVAAERIEFSILLKNNPNLSEECNIYFGEVVNQSLRYLRCDFTINAKLLL